MTGKTRETLRHEGTLELASHFEAAANIYYTSIVIAADALGHFGSPAQKRAAWRDLLTLRQKLSSLGIINR